jgi:hypothetical protein
LVVPFGAGNKEELLSAISTVTAKGDTPLALSLRQLKADFLGIRGERVVVLLTDGKEECRGDPVKAVRELLEDGFKIRIEVIGLAVEAAATKKRLRELAEITGGHYYDVRKASELELVLRKAVNVAYKVYDGNGFEVAQGFVGDGSREILPGKYKVVIFSEPLFSVTDVTVKPEGFTRIKIQSEDGQVKASIR